MKKYLLTLLFMAVSVLAVNAQIRKSTTKKTAVKQTTTATTQNSGADSYAKAESLWNFDKVLSNRFRWLAANKGYKDAYVAAGNRFYSIKNYTSAEQWYDKAAAAGNKWGYTNKAELYRDGEGHSADFNKYIELCQKEVDALHDTHGYYQIGSSYMKGIGVEKDEELAEEWFAKYGAEGYKDMASVYLELGGVENADKAIKCYLKAVELGDNNAYKKIGDIFENGSGNVDKDYKKAITWYTKALEASPNDGSIMQNIGYCYDMQKDYVNSITWYKKAAEANNALACYCLGYAYKHGEGVSENANEACKWYEKAVQCGNNAALEYAADCYATGNGCAVNSEKARKYALKAFQNGQNIDEKGAIASLPASALEGLTLYKLNTENRIIMFKLGANGKMLVTYYLYDGKSNPKSIFYATMNGTYTKNGTRFSYKFDQSSFKFDVVYALSENLGSAKNEDVIRKLRNLENEQKIDNAMNRRFKYDLSTLDDAYGDITKISKNEFVLDYELEFKVYEDFPSAALIKEALRAYEKDVCSGVYNTQNQQSQNQQSQKRRDTIIF